MACRQWNDGWVAALYGELDATEERQLQSHLEECAACRDTLEGLRASRELLAEAAPDVPATPRVVVLRPRPFWSGTWAFAAGAACALILFGAGFVTGPRWTSARGNPGSPEPETVSMPSSARPVSAVNDAGTDAVARELRAEIEALRTRLASLESRPSSDALDSAQLEQALQRFERRLNRERAQDLEYVMRSLTASELRTGTWMDQTEEALTMLALQQDPRFAER